jgi:UDP-N-acetylglucosamine 2-epimerase (non-hydrolysing)
VSVTKILFVFGTRPEAIKMAPLITEVLSRSSFLPLICLTGQHREMLDQVMSFFDLKADFDLDLMRPDQTLFDVTVDALRGLQKVFNEVKPELVFVQGDTTTVFAGALAAYYMKIPIAHLEAGLRSGDLYSPFPEEGNRSLASHLAKWHFSPTEGAAANLRRENITERVFVVGNTVIDALKLGLAIIDRKGDAQFREFFRCIDFMKRVILVTGHRRESFGGPIDSICRAIKCLAVKFPDVQFVYPVHPNPNIRRVVEDMLSNVDGVHLLKPLDYPHLIWLMRNCFIVLTDSGGIQEEAPTLGKPVLVMRDVTERQEGIEAGTAILVGTDQDRIVSSVSRLLTDSAAYSRMANAVNPYGDGNTSRRIADILQSHFEAQGAERE